MTPPRISPLGDSALTVTWDGGVTPEAIQAVRAAAAQITRQVRVRDVVSAYTTLSIFYDPRESGYETLAAQVQGVLTGGAERSPPERGREFRIPVVYDGPDLAEVARHTGLSPDDVIARHSGRWYDVRVVGFAPGWAYLGELDASLVLPRRPAPRQRVPAGSVAVANAQTGVYPFAMPGGWHLIGRTNIAMFDPSRAEPALLRVGDRVQFEPRT